MTENALRKLLMATFVASILGGLWLLASWKAKLDSGDPNLFLGPPMLQRAVKALVPDDPTVMATPPHSPVEDRPAMCWALTADT